MYDRPHSDIPRLSTPLDDRMLVRLSVRNQRLTSTQLKMEWEEITAVKTCARTVRRRLDDAGMYGRLARKKPLLTERQKNIGQRREKIGPLVTGIR